MSPASLTGVAPPCALPWLHGTYAVDLTFLSNALTYKNKALHCIYFSKNPQRATLNQPARVPSVHRMSNFCKSNQKDAMGTPSELQAVEDLSLRMGLEAEPCPTGGEMREVIRAHWVLTYK